MPLASYFCRCQHERENHFGPGSHGPCKDMMCPCREYRQVDAADAFFFCEVCSERRLDCRCNTGGR